jgi:hypothetical protein
VTIKGNQNFTLTEYFHDDFGLLAFSQTSASSGQTTFVTLPGSYSPGLVKFDGNFNVTGGTFDSKYNIPYYFKLSGVSVVYLIFSSSSLLASSRFSCHLSLLLALSLLSSLSSLFSSLFLQSILSVTYFSCLGRSILMHFKLDSKTGLNL